MSDIASTLADRKNSHGDFQANGSVMQHLKEIVRGERNWSQLPPYQREAIEMICHKLGRILCGNSNFTDHWHDIAGYATLVENILNKQPAEHTIYSNYVGNPPSPGIIAKCYGKEHNPSID